MVEAVLLRYRDILKKYSLSIKCRWSTNLCNYMLYKFSAASYKIII